MEERKEMGSKNRRNPLDGVSEVDYKDHELLRKFMSENGKILARRYTGASSKQQRKIRQAIRRARVLGLLP